MALKMVTFTTEATDGTENGDIHSLKLGEVAAEVGQVIKFSLHFQPNICHGNCSKSSSPFLGCDLYTKCIDFAGI